MSYSPPLLQLSLLIAYGFGTFSSEKLSLGENYAISHVVVYVERTIRTIGDIVVLGVISYLSTSAANVMSRFVFHRLHVGPSRMYHLKA